VRCLQPLSHVSNEEEYTRKIPQNKWYTSTMIEYLPQILSVLLIHLLAVISPGPDFIVAVKNSLSYSRKIGVYTALGFGLGIGVHVLYSVLGIALVISQSIVLFTVIKFIGALYLIYIGIMSIRSQGAKIHVETEVSRKELSPLAAIRMGFLTNVLNPKATLFFLSLFTLVISPTTPIYIQTFMGVLMMVDTFLWFSFVAFILTQKKARAVFEKHSIVFDRVLGAGLIALGVKVATSSK
jgi:RhtB (resistance to homoserine/threonine) family protein